MKPFLAIAGALSDPTRVRALLSLRRGQLCLCQIIELLQLAPSTVSKHMDLLCQAGLVERRKKGRWQHFSLAGKGAPPLVRQALAWTVKSLQGEEIVEADARNLRGLRKKNLQELSACYRGN